VLDESAAALAAASVDDALDRWVFGSSVPMVRHVYVGGQRRVADGRHTLHEAAKVAYAATLRRVLAE
jgi:formimidoylglutamate deiminase